MENLMRLEGEWARETRQGRDLQQALTLTSFIVHRK